MPYFYIFFILITVTLPGKFAYANETSCSFIDSKKQIIDVTEKIRHVDLHIPNHKFNSREKFQVIISCSSKSGSSTLLRSFKAISNQPLRFHVFTEEMHNFILKQKKSTKILLIDSMRDIISRKISGFFHRLPEIIKLTPQKILTIYKKKPKAFLKFLQKKFNRQMFKICTRYTFSGWKEFNYDCLKDKSFNFKKKYQLKKIGNLYFVNLRFDDIAEWGKIIRSIKLPINLRNFKILSANKSEDKWYAAIYKDFLVNFTISKTDFNTILSKYSEEIAHFYNEEQIENFIKKWEPHLID